VPQAVEHLPTIAYVKLNGWTFANYSLCEIKRLNIYQL